LDEKRAKKLAGLLFTTEEGFGRPFVDGPMARAYIAWLARHH